jgi:mercuric ion transport protein
VKAENISSVGTALVSFLAASCCIGPAIFVVFGASVGFLGKFAFLETFQFYFLGLGFLMLGFSFWKLYLRPQACDCKEDFRARKIARGILGFGFVSLVFAASFQRIVLWFYG